MREPERALRGEARKRYAQIGLQVGAFFNLCNNLRRGFFFFRVLQKVLLFLRVSENKGVMGPFQNGGRNGLTCLMVRPGLLSNNKEPFF